MRWKAKQLICFFLSSPWKNVDMAYHLRGFGRRRKESKTIYRSFILPQLDYADVIWDNCSLKLAEDLESLHLDAIKTIIGAVRGKKSPETIH